MKGQLEFFKIEPSAEKKLKRKWENLYNEAKERNEYLCKELEKIKMLLGKKSVELEEKQRECDMHLASTIKLEGQVEAYKFSLELLTKRKDDY